MPRTPSRKLAESSTIKTRRFMQGVLSAPSFGRRRNRLEGLLASFGAGPEPSVPVALQRRRDAPAAAVQHLAAEAAGVLDDGGAEQAAPRDRLAGLLARDR